MLGYKPISNDAINSYTRPGQDDINDDTYIYFGVQQRDKGEMFDLLDNEIRTINRVMGNVWDLPVTHGISSEEGNWMLRLCRDVFGSGINAAAAYVVLKNHAPFYRVLMAPNMDDYADEEEMNGSNADKKMRWFRDSFLNPTWQKYIGVTMVADRLESRLELRDRMDMIAAVEFVWDSEDSETFARFAEVCKLDVSFPEALRLTECGIDLETIRAAVSNG